MWISYYLEDNDKRNFEITVRLNDEIIHRLKIDYTTENRSKILEGVSFVVNNINCGKINFTEFSKSEIDFFIRTEIKHL